MQSTIRRFIESKVSEDSHTRVVDKREVPVRIVLSCKNQKSANVVRKQLADLSWKIKILAQFAQVEKSRMRGVFIPVWFVWCRLCRLHVPTPTPTNWRTQSNRKPTQRAARYGARRHHKLFYFVASYSIRILRKCQDKFDCLSLKCFFITEVKPTLHKHCDSIRAKLFIWNNSCYDYFLFFSIV